MREVTFIESFNTRTVYAGDVVEYQSMGYAPNVAIGTDTFLESVPIKTEIAPVTRICSSAKPDVFIAYSREVEEIIGVPIRVIIEKSESCEKSLHRAKIWQARIFSMSVWDRIKAVFKGYKRND
jgi:hypothetical protein